MPRVAKGHIEQLPSGSFRVAVFAGWDPATRRRLYLRATVKDEPQAQIELGRLLKDASDGRQPESGATVATLMDEYAAIAEWDVSTRQTNEGFIRRTIKPALGHLEARKVRGPVLDKLYARLKRCGDLSCTGAPFTEHRNIPALTIDPASAKPAWQQVAGALAGAIQSGTLAPGDELPSITRLSALEGIGTGVIRRARLARTSSTSWCSQRASPSAITACRNAGWSRVTACPSIQARSSAAACIRLRSSPASSSRRASTWSSAAVCPGVMAELGRSRCASPTR